MISMETTVKNVSKWKILSVNDKYFIMLEKYFLNSLILWPE